MLFVSGHSPFLSLTHRVYDFFSEIYEVSADVEVCHTNLRDEHALGFTEVNGDEQFIQIHNGLNREEFIVTLLHGLKKVVLKSTMVKNFHLIKKKYLIFSHKYVNLSCPLVNKNIIKTFRTNAGKKQTLKPFVFQ